MSGVVGFFFADGRVLSRRAERVPSVTLAETRHVPFRWNDLASDGPGAPERPVFREFERHDFAMAYNTSKPARQYWCFVEASAAGLAERVVRGAEAAYAVGLLAHGLDPWGDE